jgi:hypothetical protein
MSLILSPAGVVPPDAHASRVVGELTRLLIAERFADSNRLEDVVANGNPKAQHRLVERIKRQRTRALLCIHLTPGTRGRFTIVTVEFMGFDPGRGQGIGPDDPLPARRWLAVLFASQWPKDVSNRTSRRMCWP